MFKHLYKIIGFILVCQLVNAQFYITEGLDVTLQSESTILATSTPTLIINGKIKGKGTLALVGNAQELTSNAPLITLPNLKIANADGVNIAVDIAINNTIIIEKGVLTLSHDLFVDKISNITLTYQSSILETKAGQIRYNTLIDTLSLQRIKGIAKLSLSCVIEDMSPLFLNTTIPFTRVINTDIQFIDYNVYHIIYTPPPILV